MMKFFKLYKFELGTYILLAVLSLFLTLNWIPIGKIVGGGDVGIPTFLSSRTLEILSNPWWETQSTGTSIPGSYTAIPLYMIFSFLDNIGVTADLIQKGFIFLILVGGSLSIFQLAREFIFGRWTAFLAALFYISNFTSLSVWHRGVHNTMLMLLFMPLSLLILVRGVKNKSFKSILWVNAVSLLLSYVYGAPAYIAVIWLLWLTFLTMKIRENFSDSKERRFLITYTIILITSWVGLNMWWLYHFIETSRYTFGQFTAEEIKNRSSSVVNALQAVTKPEYILRGINPYYHYNNLDWGKFYLSPLAIFLSWIPTVIIFSTVLFKENYKKAYWVFLITLTVVVFFISKGVNAPLGDLNRLAYDYIGILAPLRNPYEKVGILLTIPFSLLFALGCLHLFNKLRFLGKGISVLIILVLSFICIGIMVWPIWKGEIFYTATSKYYFTVPPYYSEADQWLQERYDDTRILHLPVSPGESTDYDWGYTGIEPSQLFFKGSSVSYAIGLEKVDLILKELLILIHKQDTERMAKVLRMLNVGWIVVHNETIWRNRGLEPIDRINKWLEQKPYFLEHGTNIGPLSIWKVKEQDRLGHFSTIEQFVEYNQINNSSSVNIWDDISTAKTGMLIDLSEDESNNLAPFVTASIVVPKSKMRYVPLGAINSDSALRELISVKHLPGSWIYPFVRIKEKIYGFLSQNDQVRSCFNLSAKRLVESALLARLGKNEATIKSLEDYKSQLGRCTQIDKQTLSLYLSIGFLRQEILGYLVRQRAVLENEFKAPEMSQSALSVRYLLNEFMANIGFHPKYVPHNKEPNKNVMVYMYSVPQEGNYTLKFNKVAAEIIQDPPTIIQIDDDPVNFKPTIIESTNTLVYSSIKLDKGYHEIHLQFNPTSNLIAESVKQKILAPDPGFQVSTDPDTNEQVFVGEAIDNRIELSFPLENLDIEQPYEVSFEIYPVQGDSPEFVIIHDTEPIDEDGNPVPSVKSKIEFASYPVQWSSLAYLYNPKLNAISARMSIRLSPLIDKEFSMRFSRPTIARIKNLKVEKMFAYDLLLENSRQTNEGKLGKTDLESIKVDPLLYRISLANQKPPFVLNFSETFHPLWQITDTAGKKINLKHFNTNSFANAWLVEDQLPERILVQFDLRKVKTQGIIISVISFLLFGGLIFYLDRRKN